MYGMLPQMSHNRGSAQLVDVVLDPRLSYQLRPHQREGVLFLYECVMGLREFTGQGAILAYVRKKCYISLEKVLSIPCSG